MANDHNIKTVKGQKRKAQKELPSIENKTLSSRSTRLEHRKERLLLPDAENVRSSPSIIKHSPSKRERLLPDSQNRLLEEQEMLTIQGQLTNKCERLSPSLDSEPPKSERLSPYSDDESSKSQNERLSPCAGEKPLKKTRGRLSPSVDGQPKKKGLGKLSPNVEEQLPNKELGRLSPSVIKQPPKKERSRLSPIVDEQLPKKERGRLSPCVDEQLPKKERRRLSPSVDEQLPKKERGRLSPCVDEQLPKKERGRLSPCVDEQLPKKERRRLSPSVDEQLPKKERGRLSPSVDEQLPKKERGRLSPSVDEQLPKKERGRLSPSVDEQCYGYERLLANPHIDEILSPTADQEFNASEHAAELTAAQRARMERNRLRARALQDARLVQRPPPSLGGVGHAVDSGGGFLLEEELEAEAAPAAAHAPVVDPASQPRCLHCERRFPQSYLFDTFDYSVCDDCRDDEGEHSLITRTEAKNEYFLKDCDLDSRPPPLKCVRRRNPHRMARSDMRLYLAAQVRARALQVWGSEAALAAERERRRRARDGSRRAQTARRLRALRMDVRSSLYDRSAARHEHAFAAERLVADDLYERVCLTCGHVESYEKM